MYRASDFVAAVLVVTAVVWLNVPKLLLPALFVTLTLLSIHRWRREGQQPRAAERQRWQLVASCIFIALISIPPILRMVPPNGVYGFRTGFTRSSSDIWYQANAFMGWVLLAAAAASGTALTMLPATAKRWQLYVTFLGPVLCAVAASFWYLNRIA